MRCSNAGEAHDDHHRTAGAGRGRRGGATAPQPMRPWSRRWPRATGTPCEFYTTATAFAFSALRRGSWMTLPSRKTWSAKPSSRYGVRPAASRGVRRCRPGSCRSRASRRCRRAAAVRRPSLICKSRKPLPIRPLTLTGRAGNRPARSASRLPVPALGRPPRHHRSRLLPRQDHRGGCRDRRRAQEHRKDAMFYARKRLAWLLSRHDDFDHLAAAALKGAA
jgi:hypothetical protein